MLHVSSYLKWRIIFVINVAEVSRFCIDDH